MLALTLASSCDEAPDDPATFTQVREEIVGRSCAFSVCHGNGAGGLTLDGTGSDHDRLVGVAASVPGEIYVIPGNASDSYLIKVLEGTAQGARMPSGAPPLDPDLVRLVTDWIDLGAVDD